MRLYAVADIHGKNRRFAKIETQVAQHAPDALLIAGDLTNYIKSRPVLARLNALPLPVLAVRGNTDLKHVETRMAAYPNLCRLHLKPVIVRDIPFVGLNGTIPVPFRSRIRFREKALFKQAARILTRETVLVAHPPPYGFLDEVAGKIHAGSRGLYNLIVTRQPPLLLCGHIHERPGIARIGRTTVVNCNLTRGRSGVLIDIFPGHTPVVTLL